ncbi:MAG: preprotein translocase subunit SecY [Candidatus Woesearchaeota archaeon]
MNPLFNKIVTSLPEVAKPTQKRLPLSEKIKWTLIVLVAFFILGMIPLWGLGENALQRFEYLSIILGAKFGSIISLGIGPIVTASIVLQLLNGAGILKFDNSTHEGRVFFQGVQKLLALFFIVFEAFIYVFMGGLAPSNAFAGTASYLPLQLILVFQLILGGLLIMLMDEVCQKWGIGSGISLFIAAGVSQSIFYRALSPLPSPTNPNIPAGAIPGLFYALKNQDITSAFNLLSMVLATLLIFGVAVFAQSMKVEIPLSFGRVRGQGIRWPLNFIYTSNIPVILVAALLANLQLWARLINNPILGQFSPGSTYATSGIVSWLQAPDLLGTIIRQGTIFIGSRPYLQALIYTLVMVGGAVLFSLFWVQTSGMDARSQAKQILSSGLQMPGFRKDERVLEKVLERYIKPLTVMGAMTVGFLAASADLLGALSQGTGILLTVMIIYKFYEDIARQHMMDMNPMMRKFMGK